MIKYLPAEWAEQDFVQLSWPHENTDWAYMLDEVNICFAEIAKAIVKYQDLLVVCDNAERVKTALGDANLKRINFVELPTNDTWARDHGGITVFENGKAVVYDFCFNGWGMKFAANHDNLITRNLFEKGVFGENYSYRNCLDFVLEGGSIESDGDGTILTTAECLLSDNRNNMSRSEVEQKLKAYFNAERVLWLDNGYLAGDDTDSHIDTLARLCPENTIAYVKCDDETDEHNDALKKMEEELRNFKTKNGSPYRLIDLPMADPIYFDGERLPATYANFLIINNAVLVPTYKQEKDKYALEQMQKAFPKHQIIGIDCIALIKQHGSLHCVTMQYPKF